MPIASTKTARGKCCPKTGEAGRRNSWSARSITGSKNSLQLVSSFLSIQARSSDKREVQDALQEARRRLMAVALAHRRLYRSDQIETVDVARYIEELCADTVEFMGKDWSRHLTLDLSPAFVPTDRAVTLGLILTELLINANKHAYGGARGAASSDSSKIALACGCRWRTKASASRAPSAGFGSRIMSGLVAQLGGRNHAIRQRPRTARPNQRTDPT